MGDLIKPIKIENLREFQKALRQVDADAPKRIRLIFNEAAGMVVSDARQMIPRRSGDASASLKALSGQREAKIVAGGKKASYYPFLDFGGAVGRNRSVRRRVIPGGRYLFPAYSDNRKKILEMMAEGLADLARESGLDVE